MSDKWLQIPGFPGYEINELSQVRSWWTYGIGGESTSAPEPKLIKASPRYRGRLYVSLAKDRKAYQISIHRLALLTFVGPCPEGMVGCHNDGNHLNNHIDNLRWDTPKSNWNDRRIHGVASIGSKHGRTNLTELDIVEIRNMYASGIHRQAIADKFKVNRSSIGNIVTGTTWIHAGGPITKVGKGKKKHITSITI